ncbi:MAG TPA: hypothetical protein VFR08_07375 [Candidatus Angelobacter sp.]|nr:hypothetical protein [Candidatus Angelobacter sp.]
MDGGKSVEPPIQNIVQHLSCIAWVPRIASMEICDRDLVTEYYHLQAFSLNLVDVGSSWPLPELLPVQPEIMTRMPHHRTRDVIAALCLLAALLTTACTRNRDLTPAEYDVLSAFLEGKITGQNMKERTSKDMVRIVMFNMTNSGDRDLLPDGNGRPIPWIETSASLLKKAPTLQQATIDAFRKANAQQVSLHRSFHSSLDYELVDESQLEPIFKKGGGWWDAYYKQFPRAQGILTFSRVGFNSDGTQALLYYSNRCGGLCGAGKYVVMVKHDGRWSIGTEIEMWVS